MLQRATHRFGQVSSHGFHALRTTRRARAPRGLAFLSSAHAAFAFDFDDVAALARRKARAAYEPPDRVQPAELERWATTATATFVSGPIARSGEPRAPHST